MNLNFSEMSLHKRQLIFPIIFFLSIFALLVFFNFYRNGSTVNFTFFWIFIALSFISILYQILNFKEEETSEALILFQMVLFAFYLYFFLRILIDYSISSADDSYVILKSTIFFNEHNYFLSSESPEYSKWFASPITTLINSHISNIGIMDSLFTIPDIINILGVIIVYSMGKEMFKSKKVALLSCFIYISTVVYVMQCFAGHPQYLALFFIFLSLFTFFKYRNSNKVIWIILTLIFFFMAVTSNYTTIFFACVIYGIFVISQILLNNFGDFLGLEKKGIYIKIKYIINNFKRSPENYSTNKSKVDFNNKKPIYIFLILIVTLFLTYNIYIGVNAFETSVLITKELVQGEFIQHAGISVGQTLPNIRTTILNRGQYVYTFIFCLMILYGLLNLKHRNINPQIFYFTLLTGGFGVILVNFGGFLGLGSSRLALYFYPFLFLILAYYICNIRFNKKLIYALFTFFFMVNACMYIFIPPQLVDNSNIKDLPWFFDGQQEISLEKWDSATVSGYNTGPNNIALIIRFKSNHIITSYYYEQFYKNGFDKSNNTNVNIIYLYDGLRSSNREIELNRLANDTNWFQKIYTNGEWLAYKTH